MNAKLMFALVLAFALTGCLPTQVDNGTVPSVTAEPATGIPTEVPSTTIPSPTPTTEPTAISTEMPSPTPTSTPVILEEWAAAHGFKYVGGFLDENGNQVGWEYDTPRDANGIVFWVEDHKDTQIIVVAVGIPARASDTVRKEALDAWTRYLAELFSPIAAEWVAGSIPPTSGDCTWTWIGGYAFCYSAGVTGRGDPAFLVDAHLEPQPPGSSSENPENDASAPCLEGNPDPSCLAP